MFCKLSSGYVLKTSAYNVLQNYTTFITIIILVSNCMFLENPKHITKKGKFYCKPVWYNKMYFTSTKSKLKIYGKQILIIVNMRNGNY